ASTGRSRKASRRWRPESLPAPAPRDLWDRRLRRCRHPFGRGLKLRIRGQPCPRLFRRPCLTPWLSFRHALERPEAAWTPVLGVVRGPLTGQAACELDRLGGAVRVVQPGGRKAAGV